jgi:hypothetical protein
MNLRVSDGICPKGAKDSPKGAFGWGDKPAKGLRGALLVPLYYFLANILLLLFELL